MEKFIKTFQTHAQMEMLLYGNVDDKVSDNQNILYELIRTFIIFFLEST